MIIQRVGFVFVIVAGVAGGACKKKGDQPAAGSGSAAPAAAKVDEGPPGCVPGAHVEKEAGFCLKLDPSWTLVEKEDRGPQGGVHYRFGTSKSDSPIGITTFKEADFSYARDVEGAKGLVSDLSKDQKSLGAGDLPGTTGYFAGKDFGNGIAQGEVVVKGANGPIQCDVNPESEKYAAQMDMCKSLRPL